MSLVYVTMFSRLSQLKCDMHVRCPLPKPAQQVRSLRHWSGHFFLRPPFLSTFTYIFSNVIYLFTCLFIDLLIYLFICLFVYSCINLFIHFFIRLFAIHSFVHYFLYMLNTSVRLVGTLHFDMQASLNVYIGFWKHASWEKFMF